MTYNVFGGTLNLALFIYLYTVCSAHSQLLLIYKTFSDTVLRQDYHADTALIAHACINAYICHSGISRSKLLEIDYTYDQSTVLLELSY